MAAGSYISNFFFGRRRRRRSEGGDQGDAALLQQSLENIGEAFKDYNVAEQIQERYRDDYTKAFTVRYDGLTSPWRDVPFIQEALADPRLKGLKLGSSLNLGVSLYDLYEAPEKVVTGWGKVLQSTFANEITPYIENEIITPMVFSERGIGREFAASSTVQSAFQAFVTQRDDRGNRRDNSKILVDVLKQEATARAQTIVANANNLRQDLQTQIANLDSQIAGLSPTDPQFDILSRQLNTQRSELTQRSAQISQQVGSQLNGLTQSWAQMKDYVRLRNIHYATFNFLTIWRKEGFPGVFKEYGWKAFTGFVFKKGTWRENLYPPNLIKSLVGRVKFIGKPLNFINRARAKMVGLVVKYGTRAIKGLIERLGLKAFFAALGTAFGPGIGTVLGSVIGGVLQFFGAWLVETLGGALKIVGYALVGVLVAFVAFAVGITVLVSIILGNVPYPWEAPVVAGSCPIDQIAQGGGGGGSASCKLCNTGSYAAGLSPNEQKALPNGVPPLMKSVLEAAGAQFGVPASLLLATMREEGAFTFQNLTWTDANIREYSDCTVKDPIPNCRAGAGATGPFGWLPRLWPAFSEAVLAAFPDRPKDTLSECNFVDAAFASAKLIQQDKGHLTSLDGTSVCAGVTVYRGTVRPTSCSDWTEGRVALMRMQYTGKQGDLPWCLPDQVSRTVNTFNSFTCGR